MQLGTWNLVGEGGSRPIVPQQIRAAPMVQSLSDVHAFGQLDAQMPPQQSGVVVEPLQSESELQALGQEVACRQSDFPDPVRLGSIDAAVEQQISPACWSQLLSEVHVVGQSFAAVQKGVE